VGSTRPGRVGEAVARWVFEKAQARGGAEFELVDIADFDLPLLDEPVPPSQGRYSKPHTKRWAEKIASFDGFVFVTPEYNHGTSGALKNAIDFLYAEWNNKAAGFVSYGSAGGVRAVEHLRLVMAELQVADVRAQVALSLFTDFENFTTFKPRTVHGDAMKAMLDQLLAWTGAMKGLRERAYPKAAPRRPAERRPESRSSRAARVQCASTGERGAARRDPPRRPDPKPSHPGSTGVAPVTAGVDAARVGHRQRDRVEARRRPRRQRVCDPIGAQVPPRGDLRPHQPRSCARTAPRAGRRPRRGR
jgi:NAD(P)H-dependent FMN reductase